MLEPPTVAPETKEGSSFLGASLLLAIVAVTGGTNLWLYHQGVEGRDGLGALIVSAIFNPLANLCCAVVFIIATWNIEKKRGSSVAVIACWIGSWLVPMVAAFCNFMIINSAF